MCVSVVAVAIADFDVPAAGGGTSGGRDMPGWVRSMYHCEAVALVRKDIFTCFVLSGNDVGPSGVVWWVSSLSQVG